MKIELEEEYPDVFELNTYMTGALEAEKIKQIYFASSEFASKKKDEQDASVEVCARAMYDYEAQSSDELPLKSM